MADDAVGPGGASLLQACARAGGGLCSSLDHGAIALRLCSDGYAHALSGAGSSSPTNWGARQDIRAPGTGALGETNGGAGARVHDAVSASWSFGRPRWRPTIGTRPGLSEIQVATYKNSTLLDGVTREAEQAFWLGSNQSGSGEGIGGPDTEGFGRLAGIAAGRHRR